MCFILFLCVINIYNEKNLIAIVFILVFKINHAQTITFGLLTDKDLPGGLTTT